ncbi:DUF3598 family protein [Leptodesmis sp.]|uniref:DUF3598 family protein n=1 Tax=Leptodesmis sp. TaxID=3100501 RepID=UPI0040534654
MKPQWNCLFENLGEWQGSFTRLSPQGQELEDTPTLVSFEGLNGNKTMRQIVRRLAPEPNEKVLEYSTLGRGVLFFDNGAFSQGSIQFGPFSEFGCELGLIWGDRRLRLVQLFNRDSKLDQLTLIRERRVGTDMPERPPLTVADLFGTWIGEAITLYPDFRPSTTYSTILQIQREQPHRLTQQLSFKTGTTEQTLTSTATIEGSILRFEQSTQQFQVLLLSDGASCNCPTHIKPGYPFVLEVGWLIQPDLRQRMVRSYNDKGEWVSLTLVTERKE